MNRNEFKLLIEAWRGLLNESVGIDNIFKKLEYLEEEGKRSGENIIIYCNEYSEGFGRVSYGEVYDERRNKGLSGSIEFERPEAVRPYRFPSPLGGFRIVQTHETTKGFGPLLYEIIIEKVSEKGSFLMCDRESVSNEARRVWDIYMSRPDVQKVQLDINDDEAKRFGVEQLTPDYSLDDTSMESALADKGANNWSDSSLSKGYYKEKGNTPVLDFLRKSKFIDFIETK